MKMVEVKTAELIGPALDWAVAYIEGDSITVEDGCVTIKEFSEQHGDFFSVCYSPSTDWAQGGPLIEKHITALVQSGTETYWSHCEDRLGLGPTALIAACRAIVAAKQGDVVSVPAELIAGQKAS